MVSVAIFKKTKSGRKLEGIWNGKSTRSVIRDVRRAGVLTSGEFVAFSISKSKKAFKIEGIPVNKKGIPFKH